MTDRLEQLAAELAAMKPRGAPAKLTDAVEVRLADETSRRWSDRFLMSAIGSGALAACVIVAMLFVQAPATTPNPSSNGIAQVPRAGDFSGMLARADGMWVDRLK